MKYLIVVDVQKDFVDGSLGTPEAVAITDNVIKKVEAFDGEVIFTRDTHEEGYLNTQEGRNLPVVHCIRGTEGWQIIPELEAFRTAHQCKTYDKPQFGNVPMAKELRELDKLGEVESVTLVGLCTDICVVSNALILKNFLPEVPILVDAACCAGVTPEKHQAALETMASCQIRIV